jgi:sodium-independent sulfate anion transporter 11
VDTRPTLKAIILDLSSVNHVDITSVQLLVDARNQLDRHAAPNVVQWHFACIQSRWTKRALAAAGFGFPSQGLADGQARHWKSVYSIAEIAGSETNAENAEEAGKRLTRDIELGQWHDAQEHQDKQRASRISFEKPITVTVETASTEETGKAAVHGINRPFFHVDLEVALRCALANAEE